jgi:hypothetical protein
MRNPLNKKIHDMKYTKYTGIFYGLTKRLAAGLFPIAAAISTPLASSADVEAVMPLSGKMLCSTVYRHNVPIEAGRPNFIMVTSGSCVVENASPELKHEYVMSLRFDDKGVGTLLSGAGVNLHEGAPIATHEMNEAKYNLEFKDGKVVGWKAEGILVWNSGESNGSSNRDTHR